ncbi:MAG TPA: TlpA disulfide reductase family protein [Verrucomicrobiae bacterium]
MKNKILSALVVAVVVLFGQSGFAAGTNDVITDLNALVTKINAKLAQGQNTEKDLADDIKEFDVLYAKHKGEKTPEVLQILAMKAKLYLDVLDDPEKAVETFKQIKRDVPETGASVDMILDSLKWPLEAQKIRRTLVEGTKFPDFEEKDLTGKPLSLANYKGKVVLVDFWATWCMPCRIELPNVLQTYEKYHAQGFEIAGVSLDEDQPTLERLIKESKMTWQQFFDGKRYENKLARKYGVNKVPTTYLLDREGKIIGRDLRGEDLAAAVAKAVSKN